MREERVLFPSEEPSRRKVLQGAAVGLVTAAAPGLAAAQTSAVSDFAKVSSFLTGKNVLNNDVAAALLNAFTTIDPSFAGKLSRLSQLISSDVVTTDNLDRTLEGTSADLVHLPRSILSAWYMGVVGTGAESICVTYADNLANAAVSDVLSPPSYAYGPCNSWAARPV